MAISTLTLRTLAILIFSKRKVRMWPYEMPKMKIDGQYVPIKGQCLPKGTPDLIGRSSIDGRWYMCENKTYHDILSVHQKKQLSLNVSDGGESFVLKAISDHECKLVNWKTGKHEIINLRDWKSI